MIWLVEVGRYRKVIPPVDDISAVFSKTVRLPYSCKSSIPYSQFLRLRRICSDDADFDIEAAKMETFFAARGYPNTFCHYLPPQ